MRSGLVKVVNLKITSICFFGVSGDENEFLCTKKWYYQTERCSVFETGNSESHFFFLFLVVLNLILGRVFFVNSTNEKQLLAVNSE